MVGLISPLVGDTLSGALSSAAIGFGSGGGNPINHSRLKQRIEKAAPTIADKDGPHTTLTLRYT
jgi:hypothetical protein